MKNQAGNQAARNKIKNRLIYAAAVLAGAALIACGCGKTQEESGASDEVKEAVPDEAKKTVSDEAKETVPNETNDDADAAAVKSIEETYNEIADAVALASPMLMDDDFIMNYYGIDSALLEEYVFSMSEDAAKAETVILMKAKEAGSLEDLKTSLQTVVDEKKNEMENYIPEQFAIVEKSKVQTKGNYIWLVISEQSDDILAIIEKNISG